MYFKNGLYLLSELAKTTNHQKPTFEGRWPDDFESGKYRTVHRQKSENRRDSRFGSSKNSQEQHGCQHGCLRTIHTACDPLVVTTPVPTNQGRICMDGSDSVRLRLSWGPLCGIRDLWNRVCSLSTSRICSYVTGAVMQPWLPFQTPVSPEISPSEVRGLSNPES